MREAMCEADQSDRDAYRDRALAMFPDLDGVYLDKMLGGRRATSDRTASQQARG